jgi:hypothetical protein
MRRRGTTRAARNAMLAHLADVADLTKGSSPSF